MVNRFGARRLFQQMHQFLISETGFDESQEMRVFDGAENCLKFFQHGVRLEGALWQKIFRGDFRFLDAQNIVHADLHFSLIQSRLAADADKIVLIESSR